MKRLFSTVVLIAALATAASAQSLRTPGLRYRASLDFAYGISVSADQMHGFELRTLHGVDIGEHFFVGLGVGVFNLSTYGDSDNEAFWFMPLSVDARAYVNSRGKARLFFAASVGSNIPISSDSQECGGLFFQPSIGVAVDMHGGGRMHLSMGFKSMTILECPVNAVQIGVGRAF